MADHHVFEVGTPISQKYKKERDAKKKVCLSVFFTANVLCPLQFCADWSYIVLESLTFPMSECRISGIVDALQQMAHTVT